MTEKVVVVIGSGAIAQAIIRRIGIGKHILLTDINLEHAKNSAQTLQHAGFNVSTAWIDVSNRESVQNIANQAVAMGDIVGVIHTAGLSPSQASAQEIIKVDLYGAALVLEIFGQVISQSGVALVIGSQSSHRLPINELTQEQADSLATSTPEELLQLPLIQKIDDSLYAYQISKKGNALRCQYEAVRFAQRKARVNCISAGIIMTPLAYDELNSPERGAFYRQMLAKSPAGRAGTPDEIAALADLLFSDAGTYFSGSDILMDGGATAMFKYGGV
ncbi:SDR family oxidoreductase [Gallibacterium salpingitidis]|uniref:Short-chain dehydrogenase n=1 Tax=Gallibacterium salpingitidis TaxID=505341 RepID=A0A1A7NSV7_9PAST|nr:SDR family oxidoreductase [Gallibacterium salpingitidis]OBW92700.1 short-chain dehydrogenase [Gallibacterium salpingitidis]